MQTIRQAFAGELATALQVCDNMAPAAAIRVGEIIAELRSIKQKIKDRAVSLGYADRCRRAISVCGGECCIWHFPKNLAAVDFLMAVFDLSESRKKPLLEQIQQPQVRPYQCPLLREDGCIFAFESRPMVCTSAFPCLAGTAYWQYKESFREDINTFRAALGRLLDEAAAGI